MEARARRGVQRALLKDGECDVCVIEEEEKNSQCTSGAKNVSAAEQTPSKKQSTPSTFSDFVEHMSAQSSQTSRGDLQESSLFNFSISDQGQQSCFANLSKASREGCTPAQFSAGGVALNTNGYSSPLVRELDQILSSSTQRSNEIIKHLSCAQGNSPWQNSPKLSVHDVISQCSSLCNTQTEDYNVWSQSPLSQQGTDLQSDQFLQILLERYTQQHISSLQQNAKKHFGNLACTLLQGQQKNKIRQFIEKNESRLAQEAKAPGCTESKPETQNVRPPELCNSQKKPGDRNKIDFWKVIEGALKKSIPEKAKPQLKRDSQEPTNLRPA